MGRVDLVVRQEGSFRRLYAIKQPHEFLREDDEFRNMFLDEARLAGAIRHPNVVSVLDVGENDLGPYFVMDFVDGVSLSSFLRALRGERAPVEVVIDIAIQVAAGLHAAHELQDERGQPLDLVHRDVSPQNILLGFDGVVRVTDFGVARALGRSTKTATGVLKGKLGYASPEQLCFQAPDRRSDLFGFGVVLFELLVNRRLYSNRDEQGPARILSEAPPDVGAERDDLPPELVELVFELLAKDREHRPATAGEVEARLRELRRDFPDGPSLKSFVRGLVADEESAQQDREQALLLHERGELVPWPRREPTRRERPRWMLAVALLAAAAAGAGVVVLTSAEPAEENVPVETTRALAPEAPPAPPVETAPRAEPVEIQPPPPVEVAEPPPVMRASRMRRPRAMKAPVRETTAVRESAMMDRASSVQPWGFGR